ncbi:LPS export ABC transporter ATP-binding protein [Thioalkalivibrio sp. ALMg11]|uniref:LPS export ABC transporter ATP-binding protein n=1 Tax=Thioalkalivibrio sp. ALMg11 TaxID=1158165 RepID=UPI000369C5FA|nr:LPS export ABC transporter ATP-binding protein [Thioalkalivibrio sp. ALMg11]
MSAAAPSPAATPAQTSDRLVGRELTKRYGKRTVLDQVDVDLAPGEVVGLLGPNGAGKTTCFYSLVGLIRPNAGRITLGERDITRAPIHVRARAGLGYLPQEASIFRRLSVWDNLQAVLELRPGLDRHERRRIGDALIEEFQLETVRHSPGIALSGGERRRAEIARALAGDPRFICLDEPFAGVDPISVGDIQDVIRHLAQRGIGVLISDHNVRETLGICHRAYILSEGRLLAAGTPDELLADPQVRRVYLGENFRL